MMPKERAASAIFHLKQSNQSRTEHDKDIERKREKRSEAARVIIPEPASLSRREACLKDPEKFLRTYFHKIFYNPFAKHHIAMIDAIWERAWSGGDKAVAAPRGDGKSQVTIGMTACVMLATPIRFPVAIGNTMKKGRKLFKQVKQKFENRAKFPEFHGDFPEITACVAALEGAPQRAAKQHVNGVSTGIVWSQELIVFPHVHGMPWGENDWGGKRLVFFGLDSAIRGEGDEEDRPDMALIDDPETREVAFSPTNKHQDVEDMIDGDVAGLSGPNKKMIRVVLTTIQNCRCYSYRVTDRSVKPAFAGDRYALLSTWPTHRDMWDEYIAIRQKDQFEGKKDGPTATQFYRDNFEVMNDGAVLANPHRFVSDINADGDPVELDALQAFFNRVADWGLPRVLAELQQDPEKTDQVETSKLTAGMVASRISGFHQFELPKVESRRIVAGIDLGKYFSHWVKGCVHGNGTCNIVDYGVMETHGLLATTDNSAVEIAILKSLESWRSDITAENPPEFCLVDSGDFTNAAYEFIRRYGSPFAVSKGQTSRVSFDGENSTTRLFFEHCRADIQEQQGLWLYNVDSEHWKYQVQQRFLTNTFDDQQQFNAGSLSLFADPDNKKRHLSFSHHIVAEERQEQFIPGKGIVKKWVKINPNNHWLDATSLMLCAAGVLGLRVVPQQQLTSQPQQIQRRQSTPRMTTPDGRAFLASQR